MTPNEFDLAEESVICKSPDGNYEVRVPSYPSACDYIRVVYYEGVNIWECVYWTYEEIQEDDDAGAFGAAMGAIKSVFEGTYKPI